MNQLIKNVIYSRYPKAKDNAITWNQFREKAKHKSIVLVNGNEEIAMYLYKAKRINKMPEYYAQTNEASKAIGNVWNGIEVVHISQIKNDINDKLFLVVNVEARAYDDEILINEPNDSIYMVYHMEEKMFYVKALRWLYNIWYKRILISPTIKAYLGKGNVEGKKEQSWRKLYKSCKNKKIGIWGTGNAARDIIDFYGDRINIDFLIDNNSENCKKTYRGIPVVTPAKIEEQGNSVILISSTLYYKDIEKQLNELGIGDFFVFAHLEKNRIWAKIVTPFLKLRQYLIEGGWCYVFRIFPINKNKVVVLRHGGLGMGCHQKYIVEELLRMNPKLKVVWIVKNMDEKFPDNIKKVKFSTIRRAYHFATAKVWLNDVVLTKTLKKRKGQYYINTTHGVGISLKKFGFDAPKFVSKESKENMIHNAQVVDMYLAGSKFIVDVYKTAFRIEDKSWICGSPRVDILINKNDEVARTVNDRLGIPSDAKVILYAPTFRQDAVKANVAAKASGNIEQYQLVNFSKLKTALEKKYGGEWYILLRFHPMARNVCTKYKYEKYVINATWYDDPQELLARADALITDYSSIMFDMMYSMKDVYIYAPDYEEYIKNERELYFPISELPFSVSRTMDELEHNIYQNNSHKQEMEYKKFMDKFGVYEDGNASKRVAEHILKVMKNESRVM